MKRCLCLLIGIVLMLSTVTCFADVKKVELGDSGIFFSVDSKYEIITSKNKDDYSQAIRQSFGNRNGVMAYADNYAVVLALYDQGKDYRQYDCRNKKMDEVPDLYSKMLDLDQTAALYGQYELFIYDSGKIKWNAVVFKSANMAMYATVYDQTLVAVTFQMVTWDNQEIERIMDSFEFKP